MANSNLKHIVVVMMENRSFDHLLGLMKAENAELRGVAPGEYSNDTTSGHTVGVGSGARSQGDFLIDPGHEFVDVHMQLYGQPFDANVTAGDPDMSGFVKNYEQLAGQGKGDVVMRCFSPEQLPTLATLARSYAVCDAWFSSVPGPTLPNRAFAHFGTSFGRLDMSPDYFRMQPSIYQRLRQAGKRGKIYYYDSTSSTLGLTFLLADQSSYFGLLGDFKRDCRQDQLPEYAFVEPNYVDHGGADASDQHPDHAVDAGDSFLREIYDAIRSKQAVWESTLLIIVWDEHGGLYDHEVPPVVSHLDGFSSTTPKFDFSRLGVRVPAVIVSPFVEPGTVDHTPYEHASIPATVTEQFIGPPAVHSPFAREKWAATPLHLLTRTQARTDDPFGGAPALARLPMAAPIAKSTADRPVSGLLRQQVHDVHFMLKRRHPRDASAFHPDEVTTEGDAARFLERGNAILRPTAESATPARAEQPRPDRRSKPPARRSTHKRRAKRTGQKSGRRRRS
jgi:phospholipase C